jgi:hypothetical protein
MIPPGTIVRLERDNQGHPKQRLPYPPRNPETVYRFGEVVMENGLIYIGDGATAGGVPTPTFLTVRDPSVIYPVGSLITKPDNGKMYRGDGVTPGGILLQDATVAQTSPVYWGKSESATLDEAGILALNTLAKSSAGGTYSFPEGAGYGYLAFPAAWSSPAALMMSGFPLSTAWEAPYTTAHGDYWCALVTVNGVSYRVFRSANTMAGSFNIVAS